MLDYFESIATKIFSLARKLPLTLRIQKKEGLLARYSHQGIHQNTFQDLFSYAIERATEDGSHAEESSDPSPQGIRRTAERLLSFPRLPQGPAGMTQGHSPLPRNQAYRSIKDNFPLDLKKVGAMAEGAIDKTIRTLRQTGASAHGYYSAFDRHFFVANTLGLTAYHHLTSTRFAATVSKGVGKGYATFFSPDPTALDTAKVLAEAMAQAEATSKKEVHLEPGDYECVFSPRAFLEFLSSLFKHFDAKLYHDRRSVLAEKLGQPIASKAVSLEDNVYLAGQSGIPFDGEGVRKRRVPLIGKGTLVGLIAGRGLACPCHRRPTGHTTRGLLEDDIYPQNIVMAAGSRPWRSLLHSLKRGVFIDKIWYHQVVHEKDLVVTGTTIAGTCLIEKGEISGRAVRLRYHDSLLSVLAHTSEVSRERRLLKDGEYGAVILPYVKTRLRLEPA